MGRVKLPIKLIKAERSRNTTFTKRRKGLKKKMLEFSILCDVDACMIIYGSSPGSIPVTWPEGPSEVRRIIERFEKAPKEERDKRKQDISSFLRSKNKKLQDELDRKRKENMEFTSMLLCNRSSLEAMDLKAVVEFVSKLDSKIKAVNEWIESVKKTEIRQQRQGSQSEVPLQRDYFQCLRGPERRQLVGYVNPLQSAPPSSPIISPLATLPQGSYSNISFSSKGQGYSIMDTGTYGIGPSYYYTDPISGFSCGSTQDSMPLITDGVTNLQTKLVPSNCSCVSHMRPLPPFPVPFQEDLDTLASLFDPRYQWV